MLTTQFSPTESFINEFFTSDGCCPGPAWWELVALYCFARGLSVRVSHNNTTRPGTTQLSHHQHQLHLLPVNNAKVGSVFPGRDWTRDNSHLRSPRTLLGAGWPLFFLLERGDRAWEEVVVALSNQGCQFWCPIFSHNQRVDIKFDNLNNVTYQVYNSKYLYIPRYRYYKFIKCLCQLTVFAILKWNRQD